MHSSHNYNWYTLSLLIAVYEVLYHYLCIYILNWSSSFCTYMHASVLFHSILYRAYSLQLCMHAIVVTLQTATTIIRTNDIRTSCANYGLMCFIAYYTGYTLQLPLSMTWALRLLHPILCVLRPQAGVLLRLTSGRTQCCSASAQQRLQYHQHRGRNLPLRLHQVSTQCSVYLKGIKW